MIRKINFGFLAITILGCGAGDAQMGPIATPGPQAAGDGYACTPLTMTESRVRLATGSAAELHAVGGSGKVAFSLEGDTRAATIEPGGGLHAGDRAGAFTAIARDGLCKSEARARVEVVGPFDVAPASITVGRGAHLTFAAKGAMGEVRYDILDRPGGDRSAKLEKGTFIAGDAEGPYHLVARDAGSGKEARLTVTVGKPVPLRPRAEIFAVPAGGRVRLDFRGGSERVEALGVAGNAGGRTFVDADAVWFDARDARPGLADVTVRDRFTLETAKVRVLVGETLGAPPVARGTQTLLGDLGSGDLDGDGKPDIVVGHGERSKVAFEAGGILVYSAKDGAFDPTPTVIEGDQTGDHLGAVLAVRDVNGDGLDDIVAGTPDDDLGGADRGSVSIYLGSHQGVETDPDRVLGGEAAGNHFGAALAFADLDHDGALDLVTSAPGARNSFEARCDGGRIYVFRNRKALRGVMETIPFQTLDLRPVQSDTDAPVACANGATDAGHSLALLDMDGDKILDLVVGLPQFSFPQPSQADGEVLVFRGTASGKFESEPSWAIELAPPLRGQHAYFGWGVDAVAASPLGVESRPRQAADLRSAVLVVRAWGLSPHPPTAPLNTGGFFVFAPGTLGPAPAPNAHRVHVVTTAASRAYYMGSQPARALGRSAIIGDVDPSPGLEYVVSAPQMSGGALVFSVNAMVQGKGALSPIADLTDGLQERTGTALAPLGQGPGAGLAMWSAWRTTKQGPFVGAVDVAPAGTTPIANRWRGKKSIDLPNFGASDRVGQSVALAETDGPSSAPIALVGAPGAHSVQHLRGGAIDMFAKDPRQPEQRISGERNEAQIGNGAAVALDFDGDGQLDLAVPDPGESAGGPEPKEFVDPDGCTPLDAKGRPVSVGGRGVVRIYSKTGDKWVEQFRLTAPKEARRESGPPYPRNRFGQAIAAADVNGDKKDDLIVGRIGYRDQTGAEVVLGRKRDPQGRVLIVCNTGETGKFGAISMPIGTADEPTSYGASVARVGDLDKDGCDEVAMSISSVDSGKQPVRAGVALVFGYDPTGARCRGHKKPFVLHLAPDDHPLANDVVGDAKSHGDDLTDVRAATMGTGTGRVLASGSGDFTGDGVPDLVFRDTDLAFGETRGPAVEILSGAFLASLCPNHVCPKGRHGPLFSDGDWHVMALRPLGAPIRRIIPSGDPARGGIVSMTLADITGDGVADLALGVPDDSDEGSFSGEVRIYRGGKTSSMREALLGDPFLLAVGDVTERGRFGTSMAMAPASHGRGGSVGAAVLLVGAPMSTRRHAGGNVGATYRWNIEVPK